MTEKDNLPKILPPKNDIVFKMLFGDQRNEKTLIALLEAVLEKKINKVQLLNPINKQKNEDDKLSVLDVKARLDNEEVIDIEMQVRNVPEFRSRISYYSAQMLVEQIGNAGKYLNIKPVISIIIVEHSLIFESEKCHNIFSMLEKEELFPFNDLQEIHILDLSRIKNEKDKPLANWLEFINSESEEEFMSAAQKDKAIGTAFNELKALSADKEQRMRYESRLKMQRDIWSFEDAAERKGRQEGRQEGR
ncbi:MAG: Rpn family recombination-promoting nuclease/putative transposase, partial [Chitinispirillales bacterium]|nr:Rpn family recombination-promoting nuclease/putative transposase [Chitinispirillales bacterium]